MEPYIAWLVLGFTLIIIELVSGTFYLLVLGLACLGAGAAAYMSQPFPTQVIVFVVVSGLGAWSVHAYRRRSAPSRMKSIDSGMPARFESWTDPGTGRARVRYRDASWDARLEPGSQVQPGTTVYVREVEGNTLLVALQPPD